MPERKPKNQTWQGFAEQLIEAAQADGAFRNLSGQGEPIPGIDEPLENDWWLKRKLRQENSSLLPPLLEARRDIEQTRSAILQLRSESRVRRLLEELKQRVDAAIRSPLPSPPVAVLPVNVVEELDRWRRQWDERPPGSGT